MTVRTTSSLTSESLRWRVVASFGSSDEQLVEESSNSSERLNGLVMGEGGKANSIHDSMDMRPDDIYIYKSEVLWDPERIRQTESI
jgi:hypothetical protein